MKSFGLVCLGLMFLASMTFAFSNGPPDATCGIPPANVNCTQCHNEFGVNSGGGTLDFSAPVAYSPGVTYDLSVNLSDAGQTRWGFELAVLTSGNNQAGTLVVSDPVNTQLSDNLEPMPDFLKQTSDGTYAGTASATWNFQWTAPDVGTGTVTFYVAGNAADQDGGTQGDYIYTVQGTSEEGAGVSWEAPVPLTPNVLTNYPNPFNPSTTLTFSLNQPDNIHLVVYDITGRQVVFLWEGQVLSGAHRVTLDGSALASGIYFAQLSTSTGSSVRVLNLVK